MIHANPVIWVNRALARDGHDTRPLFRSRRPLCAVHYWFKWPFWNENFRRGRRELCDSYGAQDPVSVTRFSCLCDLKGSRACSRIAVCIVGGRYLQLSTELERASTLVRRQLRGEKIASVADERFSGNSAKYCHVLWAFSRWIREPRETEA